MSDTSSRVLPLTASTLSSELLRILQEVAQTGHSPLPWNEDSFQVPKSRKRPLVIRTSNNMSDCDTVYDSEGTSASEWSVGTNPQRTQQPQPRGAQCRPPKRLFLSLRQALQTAVQAVLDDWFQRTGYHISKSERKRHGPQATPTFAFKHRQNLILQGLNKPLEDPPFTVQRLAEVLLAPERCYTQTHKLCNCLEKLLLVSAPYAAFGTSNLPSSQEKIRQPPDRGRLQSAFRKRRAKSRKSSNGPPTPPSSSLLPIERDSTEAAASQQPPKRSLTNSPPPPAAGIMRLEEQFTRSPPVLRNPSMQLLQMNHAAALWNSQQDSDEEDEDQATRAMYLNRLAREWPGYQSGDSIDSTRAEDSASDSSNSDVNE